MTAYEDVEEMVVLVLLPHGIKLINNKRARHHRSWLETNMHKTFLSRASTHASAPSAISYTIGPAAIGDALAGVAEGDGSLFA